MTPLPFSVLMATYNAELPQNLRSSLDSLIEQTVKPSEIVLILDGEISQELMHIILSHRSSDLIRCYQIQRGGLAKALNYGLALCKNTIVARMDSDDYSLSNRFERQIQLFQDDQNLAICGSWVMEFSGKSDLHIKKVPEHHSDILRYSRLRSPFNHPSVMFRKEVIEALGGYPVQFPEDYALWVRLLYKGYRCYNIPEVLLRMRADAGFYARRGIGLLKGEISILRYQFEKGMISAPHFFGGVFVRLIVRFSPPPIRSMFYQFLRRFL